MTKYARKNQLKHAEMQGNKEQIAPGKTGSQKMTRKSKKQFKNQSQTKYMQSNELQIAGGEAGKQNRSKTRSQSGRSMIEMLGVLAIIAVLSIGGIVGYKLAMNHYQASQIAHEMNMMRTDAQIKIAQGTENLTLGAPYDAHKINFNNYDTAFGCKYVDENDIISDETVSCQIANAYYIELPKIPNGVCQPLARLINGMDNLIAFSVNDSEYEEGGNCQEGENDLYAVFSGETVSDLTHCEGDDDCKELESTTVCDLSRHVCVECTEEKGCEGESEYCENNVCKTCENGVWNGTSCVECTEDGDCLKKDTENPVCNTTEGKCEPCPDGQQWKKSAHACVAYECRTNEDCNPDGGFEKYCFLKHGVANSTSEWQDDDPNGENYSGECHKVSDDLLKKEPTNIRNINFYGSNKEMNWWSSCRFCAARAKTSDESCVGTAEGPSFMLGYTDIDWQCYNNDLTFHSGVGYFCKGTDANPGNYNVSSTIKKFRKMFDNDENYTGGRFIWFKERNYQGMNLHSGGVGVGFNGERRWSTNNWDRAVCRDRN